MHIGYMVQQFPPEVGAGSARVLELAMHWLAAGAKVTVLTGMPNRPEGRIHAEYRGKVLVREEYQGIRVIRSWLYASPKHGHLRTMLNNGTFMASSGLAGLVWGGGLDVLIASSPPFLPHISGDLVRRVKRIPLVLEVRDLWPDYLVCMGLLRDGGLFTRGLYALERWLLRNANAVTVVTESFRKRVERKGVRPEAIHVMPPGVDADAYYKTLEPPPIPALRRERADEFVIGYLGNFGEGQALGTVLDTAEQLRDRAARVRFVLVGDGPLGSRLQSQVVARNLRNVGVYQPIPKQATRAFYANCDVCLVPLASIPVFQETIPSKILEILACERPIIAGVDGEARRLTEDSGGGWVVPPGDSNALAAAVLRAAAASPSELALRGSRGRRYVTEHYSRKTIADRYLAVLKQVADEARTRKRSAQVGG